VEDLHRSRRYAALARQAIVRMARVIKLPPGTRRHVPGDPDDDPIVQTALSAKADYLVTADKELLKLRRVHDVQIVTAARFEQLLAVA
jgi:predicted nucleic acid-binding protein